MVKNLPAMQESWVRSLGWEDPWRRESLPTPVFLPRESHGQRSRAIVHRVAELDMTERPTLMDKKGKQFHPFISSIKKIF